HLNAESRSVVTLGIGLVGTMAALVLGLLISSAKSYYDTQNSEITQMSASVVSLDRVLAHYGPEAMEVRTALRETVARALDQMWPKNGVQAPSSSNISGTESLYDQIERLTPKDDAHVAMKSHALSIVISLANSRLLMFEQRAGSISTPMLVILIFWLTIIFISFGIFTAANATTVTSLCVSALSVSSAI